MVISSSRLMWSITSATFSEVGACESTHGQAAEFALAWARVVAALAAGGPVSASATATAQAAAKRREPSREVEAAGEVRPWNIPPLPASERSPAGRCIRADTHGVGRANAKF